MASQQWRIATCAPTKECAPTCWRRRGEFRRQVVETQLDDKTWRDYVWKETSKLVDALASGLACSIHRYELPDGHPMRSRGHPSEFLKLAEDDVVRDMEAQRDFWHRRDPAGQ